jgi:hypothetical protein
MKFKIIIVFFLFSKLLYGQKNYEVGYIIAMNNDTLYGKIKDRKPEPFSKLYKKIRFKKENSFFPKYLGSNNIIAYKKGEKSYESIGIEKKSLMFKNQYSINPDAKKTFVRVMHKGRLNYYHWEHSDQETISIDYIPFFHKNNENYMVRATQGVLGLKRQLLSDYFSDCPELSIKIKNKEIKSPENLIEQFELLCN